MAETIERDELRARRMLESALAGKPELSEIQIGDLMTRAEVIRFENDLPVIVYTDASMNGAAATGWAAKAALTADQYDMGGGNGKTLDRSDWFAHCKAMTEAYASGAFSVLAEAKSATVRRRGGIGSVGLSGVLYDAGG